MINKMEIKGKAKSYIKYSSMVFQMIGIIGLFTFVGLKLDKMYKTETPFYTAFLSLFGVVISIYIIFKSLKSDND